MVTNVTDRAMRGSDFSVGISVQADKGVIDPNPVFTPYRRTEGKTTKTVNYTEDPTVNNGMQGLEQILESKDLGAELSSSFSKQSVDLIIQALHAAEVAIAIAETDISSTATGFDTAAGDFSALAVGDGIWVGGFVDTTINGFYIVSTVSALSINVTIAPAAIEAAGASVTIDTNRAWNADAACYNTIQTRATDKSAVGEVSHHTLYDALLSTLSVEIGEVGIVTNSATFVASQEVPGNAEIAGQAYAASLTDRSVTSVKGGDASVQGFYVNGDSATCIVKSLSFEINNNHEKDESAACDALFVRGQPTFSGSASIRSKISAPFTWRDYSWESTRVEIGVLVSHGSGDETFVMFRQNVITEATMPDGNGAVSNTDASFVCEKDSDADVTVAVYRNWIPA